MTALSPPKHPPGPDRPPTQHPAIVDNHSTVPTIGTLFLLSFLAAIVIVFLVALLLANGTGLQKIRTSSR